MPTVSPLVPIVLFGWIPIVLLIFGVVPARRAVIAGFLVAWLFLPIYGYKVQGLPDYSKFSATPVGVLLGILMFDGARVFAFRPRLADLPAVAWCLVPFMSDVAAGWGPYEGVSHTFSRTLAWGVPYFIGRLYFNDLQGLRELAIGLFIGGLLYVPLCLYEIRMSPQLHNLVYGFHQHSFLQTLREGGWRPTVFMQHGLAVGTFMCTAAIIGLWLWTTRSVRRLGGIPMAALALLVLGVAIGCRSTGAAVLAAVGFAALVFVRFVPLRLAILSIVALPFLYVAARTFGGWDGQLLVDAAKAISPDRAESLEFRLASERLLWSEIQPHVWLGQGRFLFAVRGPDGELGVTPDGLWIIALGTNGLAGVGALIFMMATPVLVFMRRFHVRLWKHPMVAPAAVLAICFALYAIDCLFNAMENPLMVLIAGGLAGVRVPTMAAAAPTNVAVKRVPPWMAPPNPRARMDAAPAPQGGGGA